MNEIPFLETKGSPYEQGCQHGEAFPDNIVQQIELWPYTGKIDICESAITRKCLSYLESHFPDLIDEIRGISEGALISFGDAFWLTAFNSIPLIPSWQNSLSSTNEGQNCTGIVLRGIAGMCLGKSSDIDEKQRSSYILQKCTMKNGNSYLSLRWYGSVWTEVGLTNTGLAVGSNSGPRLLQGQEGHGIPQHCALTPVLSSCTNVNEALELLSKTTLAGKGLNISIADSNGNAAVVEKSFDRHGFAIIEKDAGAIFITNHGITDALKDLPVGENSLQRYENLLRTLNAAHYDDPVDTLKEVLSDHSEPGAICQHGKDNFWTLVTCIADTREKVLYVNGASGCQREYIAYEL